MSQHVWLDWAVIFRIRWRVIVRLFLLDADWVAQVHGTHAVDGDRIGMPTLSRVNPLAWPVIAVLVMTRLI